MKIQENVALAPLTTFNVGGPARYFVDARSDHDVHRAVAHASAEGLPLFVLGGGSNLLVADEGWPGLILKISLRGIEFEGGREKMLFHAAAGESWD
ncbi:MAG TPA: FAD-binding protein, partial [Candidatus Sulfotelmatobacter sp.]|nr:FAD-binding protein [Candidatus Sulfotelmatobacter sp.]